LLIVDLMMAPGAVNIFLEVIIIWPLNTTQQEICWQNNEGQNNLQHRKKDLLNCIFLTLLVSAY